jgi:hypothetical protein
VEERQAAKSRKPLRVLTVPTIASPSENQNMARDAERMATEEQTTAIWRNTSA